MDGFLIAVVLGCLVSLAWQNRRQRSAASELANQAAEAVRNEAERARSAAEASAADSARSLALIQEQLRISEENVRAGQRPWLFVNPVDIEIRATTAGQTPSQIYFCVENGGQSPAIDVRLHFQYVQALVLKFDPDSVPAGREEKVMIGPRSKLRASARFEAEAESSVSMCYFLGYAKYSDVIGQEHMTVWCYRYNPARSLFEPHQQYNWLR